MQPRFFKTLAAVIGVLTLGSLMVQAAGYLARSGPAALRFEKPLNPAAAIALLPPLLKEDVTITPVNPPAAAETNSSSGSRVSMPENPVRPILAPVENTNADLLLPEPVAPIASVRRNPANDLLVITPQMLAEYFRPTSNGTNTWNSGVFVPVNLMPDAPAPGFVPATPVLPSSSATYRVVP